jgi:LEA14-like dessication related protein
MLQQLKLTTIVKLRHSIHILKFIAITFCLSSCARFSDMKIGDVKDVEVKGFEENSFVVAIKLDVDNPTIHKIKITDIDTKVFLNNQYIGKIVAVDEIIFPAKTSNEYSILLRVRLTNILGTAFAMMQLSDGNKVNIRLEGDLTARTLLLKKKINISESRNVTI